MALFIEGIGGTGKGVVNLLKFAESIGELVERRPPEFRCAVVDQDATGVWPGVEFSRPSSHTGTFGPAYGIKTHDANAAARLLFSDEELRTNVGHGFHAHSKLAACLADTVQHDEQSDTHVLVYSDFGGTGAGLGPDRLKKLLKDARKRFVIAIVFGKYLEAGTSNTSGYEWLRAYEKSPDVAGDRRLLVYYLNVPLTRLGSVAGVPASGLNSTPTLLLATAYLWRLAKSIEDDQLADFTHVNMHRRPAVVETVDFTTESFSLTEDGSLIPLLRTCALGRDLSRLFSTKAHQSKKVQVFLKKTLPAECWGVFESAQPLGSVPVPRVNYAACFATTFTSVPHPWAAATWFHKAVRAGDPTSEDALRRLIALYLQGKLYVVKTNWSPDNTDMYALSTQPIRDDDPDYEQAFAANVVGGFSREVPFWTVPAFWQNLVRQNPAPVGGPVTLQLTRNSECGSIYASDTVDGRDFSLSSANVKCSITFSCLESIELDSWKWIINYAPSNWQGFWQTVEDVPTLKDNLDLLEGSLELNNRKYLCTIKGLQHSGNGLQPDRKVLPHDGIYIEGKTGMQLYDIIVVSEDEDGRPVSISVSRLVREVGDPDALAVTLEGTSVVVGAVRAKFSRSVLAKPG